MAAKLGSTMVGETMRITITGVETSREARKLAQRAAGTAAVGSAVPGAKPGAWTVDVSAKALAARKVVGAVPPARTMREAAPVDALSAVLASLDPAVAAVIREALAAKAPAPAKAPNTFVAEVLAPRAAKRAAATCQTCQDHKVVRGAGKRKGEAYTTANGAANALAPMPCPACTGKRGKRTA